MYRIGIIANSDVGYNYSRSQSFILAYEFSFSGKFNKIEARHYNGVMTLKSYHNFSAEHSEQFMLNDVVHTRTIMFRLCTDKLWFVIMISNFRRYKTILYIYEFVIKLSCASILEFRLCFKCIRWVSLSSQQDSGCSVPMLNVWCKEDIELSASSLRTPRDATCSRCVGTENSLSGFNKY